MKSMINRKEVMARLGIKSFTTLKKYMDDGVIPAGVKMLNGTGMWHEHEVDAVAAAFMDGKSRPVIRKMVRDMADHRGKHAYPNCPGVMSS